MSSPFKTLLMMSPCRRLQFNLSDLFPVPRLGLGAISAYLKAHGYPNTRTHDIIAHKEWIPQVLARMERDGPPDLLGLSVTILSLREAFEIAGAVKARFPQVVTVVGGPGVGFPARALLKYGVGVDCFVRGEGEGPLLALIQSLEKGEGLHGEIPSLIWREGDQPRENAAGPYRDLGDGIGTDYAAQPMDRYRLHPPMGAYAPGTLVETSRGCTYPCDFCCLSMPVRSRSPRAVVEEVSTLRDQFGIREFHFIDPTFTLNRDRALEIAERLLPLNIRWSAKTRVDHLDPHLASRMAASGCYLLAFGVESGDNDILSSLQKRAQADAALETFSLCQRLRIRTTAYLLVGAPDENDDTVAANIAFVRRLKPDYVLYDILQADPANPLTRDAIDAGHFTWDDLERYYLGDGPTHLDRFTVAGHPMLQAQGWLKRASTDFYIRPTYMFSRLRDLRTLQDLRTLSAGGSAFFRDALGLGRLWGLSPRS